MDSRTLYGEHFPEFSIQLGEISPAEVSIYGVQESYTDAVLSEFIMVEEILEGYPPQEFVGALYDL